MNRIVPGMIAGLVLFSGNILIGQESKPSSPNNKAAETRIKSYADLVEAYKGMNVKFRNDEAGKTLMFQTTREGGFEGVMVVKWDRSNGVVHLIQTMPLKVEKEQFDFYLKIAQKLNHGFLFPGIGINLDNGGTYYRMSIPISPRGYIFRYELESYTRFSINKAAEFLPTLTTALEKKMELKDLIPFHQKRIKDLAAKNSQSLILSGQFSRRALESEWELDFSRPGQVTLKRDGQKNVTSKITVKGNVYTFEDQEGVLKAAGTGTYQVFLTNNKLTFRLIKDSSDNRSKLLTNGVWTTAK